MIAIHAKHHAGMLAASVLTALLAGTEAAALEIEVETHYAIEEPEAESANTVATAPQSDSLSTTEPAGVENVQQQTNDTVAGDPVMVAQPIGDDATHDDPATVDAAVYPYQPTEDWTSSPDAIDGPFFPYNYRTNIFIFGDDRVPSGFDNEIESFADDKIVFDSADPSTGILPQYVHDREAGAATVSSLGYDDIATLWEGRNLGTITLSGESVTIDGAVYTVSGDIKTTTLFADEGGVRAEFVPVEDGQCNLDGVELDLSFPIQTFDVSSKSLTITKTLMGSMWPMATYTVQFEDFPASYWARGTFLLDYGDSAPNQLTYADHAVFGSCPVAPDVSITVVSGSIDESTVKYILQQVLCTGGSGAFAEAIEDDTLSMMVDTEDGFGRYFTDAILRWNTLTSSASSVSYPEIRYHEVEGVDVAELVMTASSLSDAPEGSLYLSEDDVAGNSTNLSESEERFENLLSNLIPAILTSSDGDGDSGSFAEGCEAVEGDDGVTLTCDCEEESGLSKCEMSMVIHYPTYVWEYEDLSGTDRAFDVTFDWRSGSGCDTPIREVRARNLAFHVRLTDIHFSGKKSGISFNIDGSGGFTVQGLTLAMDFDSMAQRGNPDRYDCMNRLSYCLSTVGTSDSAGLTACITDSAGADGGPSGTACPLDLYGALSAFSSAETDADFDDAVDAFDDAIEPSTLAYRSSYLDLDDAELSMWLSLSESNWFVTEDDLEELADTLVDMIAGGVEDNLYEMAATDDLMGSQGVILERIYGYRTARDLANAAGMSWSNSFQVDVQDVGGQAEWTLVHRKRTS